MADTLNLSLWFPGFDAELMLPRMVDVLRHFPFSESRGGVQYVSVQPVDWAEPTLFEQGWSSGVSAEEAAEALRQHAQADFALTFEAYWDLWVLSPEHANSGRAGDPTAPGETNGYEVSALSPEARQVLRKLHQTIRRITDDFQGRWHFNTSVAAMMELLNACMAQQELFSPRQGLAADGSAAPKAFRAPKAFCADVQRTLVLLLNPFAPYLAAELWSALGEDADALLRHPWPQADPVLAKEEEVEIVVQFNGKLRSRITVAFDAGDDSVREAALSDAKVKEALAGKQIAKVIVVKNKLVNIVIRG
jgi:hypothetical protein